MQKNNDPVGLVSVSFRSNSPREIFEAMRKAGLSCIEWGSDVHAPCNDLQRLEELVALQKEYGIEYSSYGTYFRIGINAIEELNAHVAAARMLGCKILRLWCGQKNYEDYTHVEKESFFEQARQIAALGEREDVIFCMECHNKTFTNCLQGALELMEATHSPHFQMYWQPNQYVDFETNLRYAKAIAPYTKVIHVFHWEEKNRYPLKDAKLPWLAYLACFDGSQRLLLEFMPDNLLESLGEESKALKAIRKAYFEKENSQ